MYETKKLLNTFVDSTLMNKSLEELSIMYQETNDTHILATCFHKTFNLSLSIIDKYWGLNDDDIASWCLEKLEYCLRTYNGENKFSTYYYIVFSNKLREETENLNAKKRKGILVSINELINNGVEDTYNVIEMLLPKTLTDKEFKYCLLISDGWDRKDIAEKLNVSRMTISNIEKSLRNKLFTLQN